MLANLLKPWPTHVIYNAVASVPLMSIDTSAWDGLRPGHRVLAVGRLVPAKSFDVLLDAWQSIEAPLVIAGSGPLAEVLQARLMSLGLHNRVRLLGHRDDVAQLMRSAELLVISSRNEGGPYVMTEALHARLPMVSTTVGATPEILPADALC
ncbi:MAG: glycosyltransferase, partial [Betaproteobacteria bacterium]|nr:glycosyltransferase [Betaproteobacteria bacterium]